MTITKPGDSGEHAKLQEADLLGPGLIHEMRHPLMGIKAGLELLSRRLGAEATGLEEWALVAAQVARLEELFRSYQQLFSPSDTALARFPVEAVLQRAVELLAWRLRKLGARFEWSKGDTHDAVSSPTAILHAVINLLANALDAVEPANGRVALRVLTSPLEIRVSDDGEGISAEHVARLFQPRFTTKPEGKGTGLGLHIARTVMARAGGTVKLVAQDDSRRLPWARTEFAITLLAAEKPAT